MVNLSIDKPFCSKLFTSQDYIIFGGYDLPLTLRKGYKLYLSWVVYLVHDIHIDYNHPAIIRISNLLQEVV